MLTWAGPLLLLVGSLAARVAGQNATAKVPLRIMPLGASVTFGTGSSTGNSYRKDLRDMLVQAGFEVNMVGQKKNGNFTDDDVEATGGFVIAQIANASKVATPMFKPNLVLVDAGTNNCNNGGTQPQAGHDVAAMIDNMYAASPGVTVILTTILQNKIAEQDACRVDINAQYQTLATNFTQKGAKFLLVDMRNGGPTVNDLADTRHPNDAGYQKMANVWFKGIQEVVSKGFLVAPINNGVPLNGDATSTASPATSPATQGTSETPGTSTTQGTPGAGVVNTKTQSAGGISNVPYTGPLLLTALGIVLLLV